MARKEERSVKAGRLYHSRALNHTILIVAINRKEDTAVCKQIGTKLYDEDKNGKFLLFLSSVEYMYRKETNIQRELVRTSSILK
jgi:hypothetical protein